MANSFHVIHQEPMLGGTRYHFEIAGRWAFVTLPATKRLPGQWVWYAPTLRGVHPHPTIDFYTRRSLEAGIAFAGMDVGESFGSPAGTRLFEIFHGVMQSEFALAPKAILLPQSRGGLMLYNWAARHPADVERIAGIYPVCDLRAWPGVEKAAPAFEMTAAQLAAAVRQFNPIDLLEPLARAKIPILHIHGDSDTAVPIEPHSAELARRYRALGGQIELVIPAGKGHGLDDEFFRSERFAEYLVGGF